MAAKSLAIAALLWLFPAVADSVPRPLLVVLAPTGLTRDGLPVLTRHPGAEAVTTMLMRGFSGRLLRLYAMEQQFLHQTTGRLPEPAYLLLSERRGGFPQFGFYLDGEKKPDVGLVDLHRSSKVSGRFGAMDQIFPHELMHIIMRQLAGEPRKSGSNQMHAIGVRTDPVNAFAEGFAEHVQVLSVDDEDAAPETRALASNDNDRALAFGEFGAFAREISTPWLPIRPSQMRFLMWFSSSEQVMRYHGVKDNLLGRATAIPEPMLNRPDRYPAYLLQNTAPATVHDPAKPAPVMLSTEGAVAHLFWRFVSDPALQGRLLDEQTGAAFGATRGRLSPVENVYLKLFVALFEGRPATSAEMLRAYVRRFPDDAQDVDRVTRQALLGRDLPADAPEIWLANDALMTGTSLFDQFRARPRAHTFDANAATALDWITVAGITRESADRLLAGAPYARLDDVLAVADLGPEGRTRIAGMASAMDALRARAAGDEESLTPSMILPPYAWRLGVILALAIAVGAWLARRTGIRRWWSAAAVSLTATLTVIAMAWVVISPPWYPAAAPVVLFGAPWALWRLMRRRPPRAALHALLGWFAGALPAVLLTRAWW